MHYVTLILFLSFVLGGDFFEIPPPSCRLEKSDGREEKAECPRGTQCDRGPLLMVNEKEEQDSLYFCRLKKTLSDVTEKSLGDTLFDKACFATRGEDEIVKEAIECGLGDVCSASSYTFNVESQGDTQVTCHFCVKEVDDEEDESPTLRYLGAKLKKRVRPNHTSNADREAAIKQTIDRIKAEQAEHEEMKMKKREELAELKKERKMRDDKLQKEREEKIQERMERKNKMESKKKESKQKESKISKRKESAKPSGKGNPKR